MKKLHVIIPVNNPVRYRSRVRLARNAEKHFRDGGADVTVIEAAFGERPHEVTEAGNPNHIQLRTNHEFWHKENLIRIAMQRIDADYIGWFDGDIEFIRKDWAEETVHQLQHYDFLQPFSHVADLGPNHEAMENHTGFCYSYLKGMPFGAAYEFWHPGYAWAAKRSAIDAVGGLIDWTLGAADHIMATALIGAVDRSIHGGVHPNFKKLAHDWQAKAERSVRRNIGYVPGTIVHHFHGKKKDRNYISRWDILVNNAFDPLTDLMRDAQGLYQLSDDMTPRSIALRDQIRAYQRARNEDSIDL